MAEADIEDISGALLQRRVEIAQAVFARFCGKNSARRGKATADRALRRSSP